MNITSTGNASPGDFFIVEGTAIPPDAIMEFTTPSGTVSLTPDYVRPHMALIGNLPDSIAPGTATLRLTSAAAPPGNAVSVTVGAAAAAAPGPVVQVIQQGEAKTRPYVIVFVANPAIQRTNGTFVADPVLGNPAGFRNIITHSLANLFTVTEDLLRLNNFDSRVRIVSVFDPSRPVNAANALAHEVVGTTIMETRRAVLVAFLATFGLQADMVFVIHGSTSHTRASAWFTTDDDAAGGTSYTYDGTARRHGHFPRIPGSAALSVSMPTNGLTVIHEFGHAASDFNNGMVTDLYDDGNGTGFQVNKKFRASAGSAVPVAFATYQGTSFNSDPVRDGLGYPPAWKSYHPVLTDASRPNLMDNYWQTSDPQECRLDRLTHRWYHDRLLAKLNR